MGTDIQNICKTFKVLFLVGGGDVKQQSEDTASAIKVITTSTDASHLKFGTQLEHKHIYNVCLKYSDVTTGHATILI
jgi:hypothetical protein